MKCFLLSITILPGKIVPCVLVACTLLCLVGCSSLPDLGDYSLETVKMFYDDARAAGFSLELAARR